VAFYVTRISTGEVHPEFPPLLGTLAPMRPDTYSSPYPGCAVFRPWRFLAWSSSAAHDCDVRTDDEGTEGEALRREAIEAPIRLLMGAIVGAVLSLICFSFVWGVAVPERSSGFDAVFRSRRAGSSQAWSACWRDCDCGKPPDPRVAFCRHSPNIGVVGGVLNGLAVRDLLVAGCHPSTYRAPIYPEWCGASGLRPFFGIFAKSALAGALVAAALMAVGIRRPPLN
jgi:hypothetical protein